MAPQDYEYFPRDSGRGFSLKRELAQAANALHQQAMTVTIRNGVPGMAYDHMLTQINANPVLVQELARARIWQRVDAEWHGYRMLDTEMLDAAVAALRAGVRDRGPALVASGDWVHVARENGPGYYLPAEFAAKAVALHRDLTIVSVLSGHPGDIPAGLIKLVRPDPTRAILALWQAGMWEHYEGGYRTTDTELLDRAIWAQGEQGSLEQQRTDAGGHRPDPESAVLFWDEGVSLRCMDCHTTLAADDPIRP